MARALSDDPRGWGLKASTEGLSARQAARVQSRRRASRLDAHEAFTVELIEDRPKRESARMARHVMAAG